MALDEEDEGGRANPILHGSRRGGWLSPKAPARPLKNLEEDDATLGSADQAIVTFHHEEDDDNSFINLAAKCWVLSRWWTFLVRFGEFPV